MQLTAVDKLPATDCSEFARAAHDEGLRVTFTLAPYPFSGGKSATVHLTLHP